MEISSSCHLVIVSSCFFARKAHHKMNKATWIEMVPGVHRQTLVSSEHMMQMQVRLEAGSVLPIHDHPQEQVTYIISGRLHMTIGGVLHELTPGDAVLMPGGVSHGVEVLENALVIDTFTPPRWDLLEQDRAAAR